MKSSTPNPEICFVFGTRPEIIKISPLIKECQKRDIPFITIHTGQHYSENMDKIFWDGLKLPPVNYNIGVGSGTHATQTASMLIGIEEIVMAEKPKVVIVQGDTNSVLAGALVASKLHIPIGHIEAGLRSYDRQMPEEVNRVLTGAVTSFHFTPTADAADNLRKEGVTDEKIFEVGNTIVDSVNENVRIAERESSILTELFDSDAKSYALVTVHRVENADSKKNMQGIVAAIESIIKKHSLDIVWPMHPRTLKQLEDFQMLDDLKSLVGMNIIDPVDFFDMLQLEKEADIIITDSGGIQEEACILGTPCVTLRSNTERPESVDVGANILAGNKKEDITSAVDKMLTTEKIWSNPFGDGKSAHRIIDILSSHLNKNSVG